MWRRRGYVSRCEVDRLKLLKLNGHISCGNSIGSNGNNNSTGVSLDVYIDKIKNSTVHIVFPFQCCVCNGNTNSNNSNNTKTSTNYTNINLHRCRMTYDVYYCSEGCANSETGRRKHYNALLARHLICNQNSSSSSGGSSGGGGDKDNTSSNDTALVEIGMSWYRRVNAPPLLAFEHT